MENRKVIEETKDAIFSLIVQLTDGEANNMILIHSRKGVRNGYCSLLELNARWDPQPKSGKLAALVELVTPAFLEHADDFLGKLMDWEAKEIEAKNCFGVELPGDIKTTIFISMALGGMLKEPFKTTLFDEGDFGLHENQGMCGK